MKILLDILHFRLLDIDALKSSINMSDCRKIAEKPYGRCGYGDRFNKKIVRMLKVYWISNATVFKISIVKVFQKEGRYAFGKGSLMFQPDEMERVENGKITL